MRLWRGLIVNRWARLWLGVIVGVTLALAFYWYTYSCALSKLECRCPDIQAAEEGH
jgi:hypothetical protein